MGTLNYRPEIDGLRAFAIIPVVLFHAGIDWLSGGYLGVDIFFVISGYLITALILREKEAGSFALLNFWERRARRILPALFCMVLICIPLGWLLFLPKELWEFQESVGSVALFLSNHLFLDQSGYFDNAAERKPLLHTWSLAVEEQFYLLFPLLSLALWRSRLTFLIVISIVVVSSLVLAQWLSVEKPAAAFYLLPTRAWELGIGSLLAIWLYNRADYQSVSDTVASVAAIGGLILIVSCFYFYTPETPSPSLYTLVPVLGAALVIAGSNSHNAVGRFLGLPLFVGVGLISFSLYLWHQPIFAFARVQSLDELAPRQVFLLLVCTVVLAYCSWKWIETPFRNRQKVSYRVLAALLLSLSAFYVFLGLLGYNTKKEFRKIDPVKHALSSTPTVMLFGDSHASHLLPGLEKFLPGRVKDYSRAGCLPLYGVDRYDSRGKPGVCPRITEEALDRFRTVDSYKTLILSSMGPVYLTGEAFRGKDLARVRGMQLTYSLAPGIDDRWTLYELALRNTLARLSQLDKRVIFVIDVPELGVDPLFCDTQGKTIRVFGNELRIREADNQRCYVTRSEYDERTQRYRNLVNTVLPDYPKIIMFDPINLFCDQFRCDGIVQGKALYKDADHLSIFGSEMVAASLVNLISD
jgi:peptidoglycan/LPS O-acetylase OafA/YrhL